MEITNRCAPVLILTLCRFVHLKNCINSLKKNIGVEYTDLFIALDYPLKNEQWDGYNQIKEYVKNIDGFKSINIMVRDCNYGVMKNLECAFDEIFTKYDRLIFSEDDNIFSPNFLLFMNNGLDKFKYDQSILAINGYRSFYDIKFGNNNFFYQNVDFSAWGYGIWKDRYEKCRETCNSKYFKKNLFSSNILRIIKNGSLRLYFCIIYSYSNWNEILTDNVLNVYMAIENMYVVMPTISKVRNMGWDGTGVHCNGKSDLLINMFHSQKLDDSIQFDYIGEDDFIEKNRYIFRMKNYNKTIKNTIKTYLYLFIRICLFWK
jgi:hypothetical protein